MWAYTLVEVECDGTNYRGRGRGHVMSCLHLCCAGGLHNMLAHSCHCDCLEESHTNRKVHTYKNKQHRLSRATKVVNITHLLRN